MKNLFVHRFALGVGMLLLMQCAAVKPSVPLADENDFTFRRTALSEQQLKSWPWLSLHTDTIPGISIQEALTVLKGKQARPVTVAIIDSGIDTEHEALQNQLWTNSDEQPGNGKDDDQNGYLDDVIGWNFLGELRGAPFELTRLVALGEEKFLAGPAQFNLRSYAALQAAYQQASEAASKQYESLNKWYKPETASAQQKAYHHHVMSQNQFHYNLWLDPRELLGDDPNDIQDTNYGNGDVTPQDAFETHGTHVAGIVASITKSLNVPVQLMPIRCTPNGDEYDKDVALAIRYAVDNGAQVINLSFGKSYSQRPDWVMEAIQYAAQKQVLIVHAAGNNSQNMDSTHVYPNDRIGHAPAVADNFVRVGAITRFYNEALVSPFSNYGQENVDLFAPGSKIYSALPGNAYDYQQGTSMAAPMVAGVAAVLRSYFPELTADEVKKVLMNSGNAPDFEVILPGSQLEKVPFSTLSQSGRILNAYQALKYAAALKQTNTNQQHETNK